MPELRESESRPTQLPEHSLGTTDSWLLRPLTVPTGPAARVGFVASDSSVLHADPRPRFRSALGKTFVGEVHGPPSADSALFINTARDSPRQLNALHASAAPPPPLLLEALCVSASSAVLQQ